MCRGQRVIQAERLAYCGLGVRKRLRWCEVRIPSERGPAVREPVIGERVIRVLFNCLLEMTDSSLQIYVGPPVPEKPSLGISQVGVRIESSPAGKPRAIAGRQGYSDFVSDSPGDFTLQRK